MIDRTLLEIEQGLLAGLISQIEEVRRYGADILTGVDHSLVSSCWQKAIRRSDPDLASSCVATLHASDPAYVWRRLRGIVLEEVSAANLELVGQVMAIAGKKALRSKLGDLKVAHYLTRALADSPKCRTACDLLMWLEPPSTVVWEEVQASFGRDPAIWSVQRIANCASAWQSVVARSVYRRGRWVQLTQGDAKRRDQLLEMTGCPPLVKFIVRRGNSTDSLNSLMVPVFQLGQQRSERFDVVDLNSSSIQPIGRVPAYSYCLFSGPGRAALRRLLSSAPSLMRFCKSAGIADPLRAVGHAVFQLEGSHCQSVWEVVLGPEIKHKSEQATLERFGVAPELQIEIRERVRALLPCLNQLRVQVGQSGPDSKSIREERHVLGGY